MTANWVDYKEVKSAVSMAMVLNYYGVAVRRVNKTYLRGRCPLPTHGSEASKESFGVQTEKNIWACQAQSCVKARGGRKGGNVLDFVAFMESCTVRDAALKLQDWFMREGVEASNGHATAPAAEATPAGERAGDESRGVNKPLPFALKGIDSSHPYLAARGIAEETAAHFGVGFFPGKGSMAGRVVIPIHNAAGELVAYAGRAPDEATEPRYKLPASFNPSVELFNLHRAIQSGDACAVVVAGFFDAMNVHQAGFASVVALMGTALSDTQAEALGAHFNEAVLLLGGDEAGREAAPKIAAQLARHLFVRIAEVPEGKQPAQLTANEINPLVLFLPRDLLPKQGVARPRLETARTAQI
jgi:DNA primase